MTSGQAHVPSEWSRNAMTSAPYQVNYEVAPANYPAIPAQYAPQPQYQVATYGDQAPIVPYPNQSPAPNVVAQPEKEGNKVLKYIAIGAASLVAVGAVGTVLMLKGIKDTVENSSADNNTDTSAHNQSSAGDYEKYPIKLTTERATGDQFVNKDPEYPYNYTRSEQLDYAAPKLNDDAQSAAERARVTLGNSSNLTEDDGLTTRTIAKPSLANTPQQILDQFAVGTFQAWESAHQGNLDEAKKLAAATADLDYTEYQDQVEAFNNDMPTLAEGVAWGEKPTISSGEYDGVQASADNPVIAFNKTSASNTNDRVRMVFRFEKGTVDDSSRWILVKTTAIG